MSKKPDTGWILPAIVDPPRKCICIPVPNEPAHRQAFFGALIQLGYQFNWQRDSLHKAVPVSVVWMSIILEAMERFYSGDPVMCFSCEELNECLAPLYAQIAELTAQVEELREVQENNGAKLPEVPEVTAEPELCGGAIGVVDYMDGFNRQMFRNRENSLVDNVFEFIPVLIEWVPFLSGLPFDELFELANTGFETQVLLYEADFASVRLNMASLLACRVADNAGIFDIDVWAAWLDEIGTAFPGNRAAALFARFSPLRQTFVNQILEFINGNASLQSYFDQTFTAWTGGVTEPSTDCIACGLLHVVDVFATLPNFGGSVIETRHITSGISFEVEAVQLDTDDWGVAIETDGDFTLTYNIDPDPVITNNPGVIVWLFYGQDDNIHQGLATAEAASDFPSPSSVRLERNTALKGAQWGSLEPFTLTITLTNA